MDYSKMSDQEINGLVMDVLSDGNQAYRAGNGANIELLRQVNAVEFGEHIEREEAYATFDPCNFPEDAWPIIQSNGISIIKHGHGMWLASPDAYWVDGVEWQIDGENHPNPLRAAMTVFLLMQESANVQDNPAR